MKPTHIHDRCCHCNHPLVPARDRQQNAEDDEWVCGREWEPGSGLDICDGFYTDYTLEQFQEVLGLEMGLKWWEANRKRDQGDPFT